MLFMPHMMRGSLRSFRDDSYYTVLSFRMLHRDAFLSAIVIVTMHRNRARLVQPG
jgi:hypothetical protein